MSDQITWQKDIIKDELTNDIRERKMIKEERAWIEELQQQRKYKRGPRRRASHMWRTGK